MTSNRKQTTKSYLIALPFFLVAVFLDQFSKWLAIEYLKEIRNFPIIEGVFSLHYLENRGAVFGIFYGWQAFLITLSIFISIVIIYFYSLIPHTKRHRWLRIATVLIISGAIGNLIDRIRLGFVVDFFFFELINFPVFNIADSYVVIACILFLFVALFYYKEEELEFIFSARIFSPFNKEVEGNLSEDEDLGELHGPFTSVQEMRAHMDTLDLGNDEYDDEYDDKNGYEGDDEDGYEDNDNEDDGDEVHSYRGE